MSLFDYHWPGRTLFGNGAIAQLGHQAQKLGGMHAFVVLDPGVTFLIPSLIQSLDSADISYTIFDQVITNPDALHTDHAADLYELCGANLIIGVGGGSALDVAKGVRILAGSPEGVSVAEYLSTRGKKRRPDPHLGQMPPMIAVPTTAGTGSEATPWGVVTDHKTKQRASMGTNLMPNVAILDPELTRSLPKFITAATGMDALSHLIEAYVSTHHHPLLDSLILHGIAQIGRNLRLTVYQPDNLQARAEMMNASFLGGLALSSNGLGACHALAHPLSTFVDLHHGLACAILLPHQMRWSVAGAVERYAKIAEALDPSANYPRPRVAAEVSADLVEELLDDLHLPTALSLCGVSEELLPTLANHAFEDEVWHTNPIRPTSSADFLHLYRTAF